MTTYWTAARAAKLDFLTANVAVASTAVSNADYTSARAAALDSIGAINTKPTLASPISAGWNTPTSLGPTTTTALSAACVGSVATTTSTTYVAAVNVTGKGVLNLLAFFNGNGPSGIRLTIDGNVIFTATPSAAQRLLCVGCVTVQSVSPNDLYGVELDQIPFNQSLLIEHYAYSGATVNTVYKYRRTA